MSERIYGIDLGTSTSAVAYADANDVKLVRAQGPERSDITPSKVCIAEGPTAYVGRVVDMVVEEFQFEDEEVGPGERRRHYRSFEEFKRDLDNPGQKPTEYQSPIAGTCWTPTCLSALVLRKLAQDVALTHRDAPLRKAVITHPQHFYIGQKKATAKAASLANIEVAMTVSEPLAAAVDLRYGANPVRGLVALVDLGGGTLDINILDVQNGTSGWQGLRRGHPGADRPPGATPDRLQPRKHRHTLAAHGSAEGGARRQGAPAAEPALLQRHPSR
jgi:molecular chaperone DnaK